MSAKDKLGDVIPYSVQKGGVGKSSGANSMAYVCAERGHKTILVDLDPQATQTGAFFGYSHKTYMGDNISNVANIFREKTTEPIQVQTVKYIENPNKGKIHQPHYLEEDMVIDFIPSNKELLDETESDRMSYKDKIDCIVNFINELRKKYDKVIIDCPPSFGLITKAVMITAETLLVPIATKSVDTDGLVGFFDALDDMYKDYDMSGLRKIVILPNMFDKRVTNSKDVLPELKRTPNLLQVTNNLRHIECKVLEAFPQRSCVQEAPSLKMFLIPFIMDYSRSNKDLILHLNAIANELDS